MNVDIANMSIIEKGMHFYDKDGKCSDCKYNFFANVKKNDEWEIIAFEFTEKEPLHYGISPKDAYERWLKPYMDKR